MLKVRYYLELISMPIFVFIVWDLSSHSLTDILATIELTEFALVIASIMSLMLFVTIWHLPQLKKLVPCSHEHCHGEQTTAHIMAIIALCLHFFPEAEIRYGLWQNIQLENSRDLIVLVGFTSHFVIDIIIAVFISCYWPQTKFILLSLLIIIFVWCLAFILAINSSTISHLFENPWGMLLSGFLLAMFIHMPHKPISNCSNCH